MSLTEDRRQGLQALGLGDVRFDVPLAPWTHLGIGGPAEALVIPGDEDALRLLRRWCRRERLDLGEPPSDPQLLVRDGGLRGVILVPSGDPPEPARSARLFLEPNLPISAAQLLRDSGAAGIRLRGVRIDSSDPNVVINEGAAQAQDVVALQAWLGQQVKARTGVELESALTLVGIDQKR